MSCPRCGSVMAPGAGFCSSCGMNLGGGPQGMMPPTMTPPMPQRTSGLAIAGFIVSFFCGVVGLVLSILGRNECKRSGGAVGGGGLAIAGIVISALHLVAAVLYLVVVLVFAARVQHELERTRSERASMAVKMFAYEGYPQWAMAHPDKQCPASIDELTEYTNERTTLDPWGRAYVLQCGASAPAGTHGVLVMSGGEDGQVGTADDVTSAQ